jgi:hypothetical protein
MDAIAARGQEFSMAFGLGTVTAKPIFVFTTGNLKKRFDAGGGPDPVPAAGRAHPSGVTGATDLTTGFPEVGR